jgi:flagellar basal body-associated protein FliL
MLLGLAVFAVAVETAVLLKPPDLVTAALMVIGITAWFAGACSMVGYVRWFFASEMAQAKRDKAGTPDKENDVTPR